MYYIEVGQCTHRASANCWYRFCNKIIVSSVQWHWSRGQSHADDHTRRQTALAVGDVGGWCGGVFEVPDATSAMSTTYVADVQVSYATVLTSNWSSCYFRVVDGIASLCRGRLFRVFQVANACRWDNYRIVCPTAGAMLAYVTWCDWCLLSVVCAHGSGCTKWYRHDHFTSIA